jgi:hypothetical protein
MSLELLFIVIGLVGMVVGFLCMAAAALFWWRNARKDAYWWAKWMP